MAAPLGWVSVLDSSGFSPPIEAFRLRLPEDWTPEGGVFWLEDRRIPSMCMQVQFRALSPDRTLGIELLPHYVWGWSDDPAVAMQVAATGESMMPPMGAVDFLRTMVLPSQRPRAAILAAEQDRLAADRRARLHATDGAWAQSDVARVRIGYWHGRRGVEEDVYCAIDDRITYVRSVPGAPPALHHAIVAQDIVALRFPAGRYAEAQPLLDTIVDSIQFDAQWSASVQQALTQMVDAVLAEPTAVFGGTRAKWAAGA